MGELGRCRTGPSDFRTQDSGLRTQASDLSTQTRPARPHGRALQRAAHQPLPGSLSPRVRRFARTAGSLCRETCGGRRSAVGSAANASGAGPRERCGSEMPGRPIVVTARSISGISPDGEIAVTPRGARRAGVLAGRAPSPGGRPRRTGVLAARAARASLARATQRPAGAEVGPGVLADARDGKGGPLLHRSSGSAFDGLAADCPPTADPAGLPAQVSRRRLPAVRAKRRTRGLRLPGDGLWAVRWSARSHGRAGQMSDWPARRQTSDLRPQTSDLRPQARPARPDGRALQRAAPKSLAGGHSGRRLGPGRPADAWSKGRYGRNRAPRIRSRATVGVKFAWARSRVPLS
ncbi:hypothetical protein Poly30_20930 [Planctomycetes bacterium Poly30]|uniref:Uncharacterized protein n=1 Tax=Saltatorellus ferox TaxID=2528018 RepID=A0A518ER74_9BACT|nr:hypothetical protein Poly30_20930 [Planctomycetes bacterium Poly30]